MPEIVIYILVLLAILIANHSFCHYQLLKFRDALKPGQTVLINYQNQMTFAQYLGRTGNHFFVSVRLFGTTEVITIKLSKIYKP